jgi:DNA-binding transcriptional LysR family regulator
VGEPLPRNLRADDLLYLLAVANSGRLVAAADHLRVDHSTVSRRLRVLEKVFGAPLLDRGAEGWELTELGKAVADHARPIEQALEQVSLAARGARGNTLTGNLRITAPDGFGTHFVVPAMVKLREQHPALSVELITATRQLSLHQSGFDLAIAVGKPVTRRLFVEELCRYRLALYASGRYLATHGRPKSIEELKEHTIIFYIDSLLQVGDLDLGQYVPGVDARFTSTNIFAQLEATACGAGIGLLPRFLALRVPDLQELTDVSVNVNLAFTLAARRESMSRPAVRAVRQALHREVQERRHELLGGRGQDE